MCMYCEVITTIRLVDTSFTSRNYNFFFCRRTFKIDSLSNFQTYNNLISLSPFSSPNTQTYFWLSWETHCFSWSYSKSGSHPVPRCGLIWSLDTGLPTCGLLWTPQPRFSWPLDVGFSAASVLCLTHGHCCRG